MKLSKLTKLLTITAFVGTSLLTSHVTQAADVDNLAPYTETEITSSLEKSGAAVYPIGQPNTAYEKYFTGPSFLYGITSSNDNVNVANVTFAPGTINHWHVHHGSCQVLAGVSGTGYYQIWGQPAQEIKPGMSVVIPENTKHWHGASQGNWFQHLSIMGGNASTEWLEPVNEADYAALK